MKIFLAALLATLTEATLDGRFVESLYKAHQLDSAVRSLKETADVAVTEPTFLMHAAAEQKDQSHRHLEEDQLACDQAFMKCMPNNKCVGCFGTLQTEGIDWASVAPGTPCRDVVDFLNKGKHCMDLQGDSDSIDVFCSTFDVCVAWYEDGKDEPSGRSSGGAGGGGGGNSTNIDCEELTECNWEGMHRGFLGDGICHENYPGCYNTAICNFDGGDCCKETCIDVTSYAECGHDGYACRDPKAKECDPSLTRKCEHGEEDDSKKKPDPNSVQCGNGESKYRLVMFDSFGDGWDTTMLTLTPTGKPSKKIFKGNLEDGAQGTEFVCLSDEPTCYDIDVSGGVWGNEVSWELRPLGEGTKALADGGAPMKCSFPVAGQSCDRTCTGKPNQDPKDDADYKTYKDLYTCIQDKCLIQVGTCMGDTSCSPCFAEDAPEYCFANDNFNAVIDCGLCQCTDKYSEFCNAKTTPGKVIPTPDEPDSRTGPKSCTAAETLQGSNAVLTFSKCTNFDQVGMMVTDFDENNFGALDTFEACAHSYQNDNGHGGKTAMFCMQILADAINNPIPSGSPDAPGEAISALAGLLYHKAEDFCECASSASADCPLCPSFMRFKTLLYESLDACKALDEIDCDAWNEFYPKCKANLEDKFTNVDFRKQDQCDFVKDKCGDAGPFPAFRKLDCNRELPAAPWDFYLDFSRQCLKGDNGVPPSPPAPTGAPPTTPPTPATTPNPTPEDNKPAPTSKPYSPADGGGSGGKPYIPTDDDTDSDSKADYPSGKTKTGTSHFWRNIIIMGVVGYGAYWYYKKHNDSFSFVRYRQAPQRNFGTESDMMMNGRLTESSSFEPPSLPPPPSAMNQYPQGGGYP